MESVGDLGYDSELMWDEINPGSREATCGRAANESVPTEGFQALIEIAALVGESGYQPLVWPDEGERIQQITLVNFLALAVIRNQSIFLGQLLHRDFGLFMVGNFITRAEPDAD